MSDNVGSLTLQHNFRSPSEKLHSQTVVKSYYLSERKVTDKVSFKKEMLEQIENNIKEKVTLEMDLSPYIRDAVLQTFHGQPMPTKESLLGKRRSRM